MLLLLQDLLPLYVPSQVLLSVQQVPCYILSSAYLQSFLLFHMLLLLQDLLLLYVPLQELSSVQQVPCYILSSAYLQSFLLFHMLLLLQDLLLLYVPLQELQALLLLFLSYLCRKFFRILRICSMLLYPLLRMLQVLLLQVHHRYEHDRWQRT